MSLEVNIEKKLDGFTLRAAFTVGNTSTALLGASGCGKSMTLRCIAGIVKPDRGRIVLDGRVLFDSDRHIDLPPQQRGVGLLFQNYALFPNMTVEQNILSALKKEKDPAARRAACAEALPAPKCCAPCGWKSWQNATLPSFPADSSSAPRWHAFWWASPVS